MTAFKQWLAKIMEAPPIAHLMRANKRFGGRLGNQFGAAITYFSVLAIVPIIMFAFSVLGFVLVTAAPQLMQPTLATITDAMSGLDEGTRKSIKSVVENALQHYAAIGIIGAISALYSGAGWMGNLKDAVRAQWRPSFDMVIKRENFVVKTLTNLVSLLGLLIMLAVTFAVASVSTSLSGHIVSWLGLVHISWLSPVLKIIPVLVSIGAGWLIFMYLYVVLPETREPWKAVRRGALIGAVGLGVLEYLTSFLIGKFASNPAAALFGPVIALMLFFNLFARLILFVAAWIGTADHPAEPEFVDGEPVPDASRSDDRATADQQSHDHGAKVGAGHVSDAGTGAGPDSSPEGDDGDPRGPWTKTPGLVPVPVAARSVRVGTRAGYLVGAATGIGAGSVLAQLIMKLRRR